MSHEIYEELGGTLKSDGAQREMTREELLNSLIKEREVTQQWYERCGCLQLESNLYRKTCLTTADESDKYHHERDERELDLVATRTERDEARTRSAALQAALETTCWNDCAKRPDGGRKKARCGGCHIFSVLGGKES